MDIVLVRPLIPQNTAFIAKMCVATGTRLHIVGEPGFRITPETIAAAGLTYWRELDYAQHPDFGSYLESSAPARWWCVETSGARSYAEVSYGYDDALVFGSETVGLGEDVLGRASSDRMVKIPILSPHVRSLNLSNAVAIVLFEARRQLRSPLRGV